MRLSAACDVPLAVFLRIIRPGNLLSAVAILRINTSALMNIGSIVQITTDVPRQGSPFFLNAVLYAIPQLASINGAVLLSISDDSQAGFFKSWANGVIERLNVGDIFQIRQHFVGVHLDFSAHYNHRPI